MSISPLDQRAAISAAASRFFEAGIGASSGRPGLPEDYLKVPVQILVGSKDVGKQNLRESKWVNKQQGQNRLERARRWVASMQQTAKEFALESKVGLTEVPGIGHGFTDFCRNGDLINRVFCALFPNSPTYCPPDVKAGKINRSANGNS